MRWNSKNKARYESLGYIYTKMKDEFDVRVEDLPRGSSVEVEMQCDYCGKRYTKLWYHYLGEHHEICGDACYDCKYDKWAAIHRLDHPDEPCPFRSAEANAHREQTNIERYGSVNVFGNKDIQQQIRQHYQDVYGVTSYTKTKEYRDKTIKTCMERYGVPYYIYLERHIGAENPRWKGGISMQRYERSGIDYAWWRRGVFSRDRYQCQCCGQHHPWLEAHHKYNWKDYPDKRYDIDNGVTLCKQCHLLFHSLYGKKNNTPEQYNEFCELRQKDMLNYQENELIEPEDKKLLG